MNKSRWFTLFETMVLFFFCLQCFSQITLDGHIDVGGTYAQDNSHYFYNEVNSERKGWSVGLSEARLYTGYEYKKAAFHLQQSATRRLGGNRYKYQIEQLSFEYSFLGDRMSVGIGRMIHPIGRFYNRQLSHQRNFLSAPLQYSYYQNVSQLLGYQPALGENGFKFEGDRIWGSSMNYRYGYINGISLSWSSLKGKIGIDMAIGDRSTEESIFGSPAQWEWTGRLSMDVNWALSHGLSLRYYSFRESSFSQFGLDREDQLGDFKQWQVSYDIAYGISYFEILGEMSLSNHSVPLFDNNDGYTIVNDEVANHSLTSITGHLDIKIEPPFLSGMSIAYRLEHLHFGDYLGSPWDNNVWRNSLALSYKLNRNILLRSQYSIQNVSNKSWDQDFFRMAIIFHL